MSIKAQSGYPGTISLANPFQAYPGAKAKWFWSVGGYNRYFTEKPNEPAHGMLVVRATPTPYFLGLLIGVMVEYTKQLSPQEEADMQVVTREVELKMAGIRQKREAEEAEARQVQALADEELKRLAGVGRRYEDRTKHMRTLDPSLKQRNDIEVSLNRGDPEVLFGNKSEAFTAGYVKGYESGKEGDE